MNDNVYWVFGIGICDVAKGLSSNGFLGILGAPWGPKKVKMALWDNPIFTELLVLLLGISQNSEFYKNY